MTKKKQKLVVDIFPGLAEELQRLLLEQNDSELAAQVLDLAMIDRCRCGDDFCGTFYVLPKPGGAYGPGHRNVAL